ncbi:MAG: hypothetical protein A4S14_05090 [Proteobacteria bacterium SG_bin9]|nr:MAG: hypothetical protein A4S14_05090 [Proteobacteria bacterium SG_bin9]
MRALAFNVDHVSRSPASAPAQIRREPATSAQHEVQAGNAHRTPLVQRSEPARIAPTEVAFGPFRLIASQFLLLDGDKPIQIGSRALEILIALLERPGELIGKQELMARVWPNVFVEPANLTVNISALRRALRDGQDGNRFIINVPGRGYCFVAGITTAAAHPKMAWS